MRLSSARIISFNDLDKVDLELVGKKAYQLCELKYLKILIPNGFVIMPSFFNEFLKQTGISKEIEKVQSMNHPSIESTISKLFLPIQKKIMHTHIPQDLSSELHRSYRKLAGEFKETSLNIFTSPVKGKSMHFSNIKGDANLILKLKEIWAENIENPTCIVVQKSINSKIMRTTTNAPAKEIEHIARKIQKHFYFPQEIDYAIEKNKIYITLIKPVTPLSQAIKPLLKKVLLKGIPLTPGIATGAVRVLRNQDYFQVKNNEIAVIAELDKLLYSKISKAKAIVADGLLNAGPDKINYKYNIKVPTVIGAKNAINILHNGNIITVNAISGEIYQGGLI